MKIKNLRKINNMNNLDNINELNNLDPLDLAFLFLDGEANETEKRILFEELSKDENLQKEFGEAIEMKYAGIEEAKDLTPPIGLTNAIYGTLGVGAAHTVGNLTQNYGRNYFNGLVNSASNFISPIYMMITSFIMGGLLSYFAFDGGNNDTNNNKNISPNSEKIIPITQISETKNVSHLDTLKDNFKQNNNIDEQEFVQVLRYNRNETNPTILEIDTLYYTKDKVNKLIAEQDKLKDKSIISNLSNDTTKNFKNDTIYALDMSSRQSINDGNITIINPNNISISKIDKMPILTPNENIDYKLQVITPIETNDKMNIMPLDNSITTIKIDTLGNITTTNIDPSNITTSKINPFTTEKIIPVVNDNLGIMPNNSQDYEVKIITINSMTYFQNKPNFTDNNTNFNNIQVTGLYKISDNQKVGLSIGNEDYPRYVKFGEDFVLTNDLTYLGGVYNYNFLDVNFAGNIKSNVNLLLGFASESLVNKSGIEINWKPDSKLSLNFGIETLLNMANYNNAYEYTGKLNFYYGVSYNF